MMTLSSKGVLPRIMAASTVWLVVVSLSCAAGMRSPAAHCTLEPWPELCRDERLECMCSEDTLTIGMSSSCRGSEDCGFRVFNLVTIPQFLGSLPPDMDRIRVKEIDADYIDVWADDSVRELHLEDGHSRILDVSQMTDTLLRISRSWPGEVRISRVERLPVVVHETSVRCWSIRDASVELRAIEQSIVGRLDLQDVRLLGAAAGFLQLGEVECDAVSDFLEMLDKGYSGSWRCLGLFSDEYLGRLLNVTLPCGNQVSSAHLRRERSLLECLPAGSPHPDSIFEDKQWAGSVAACPTDGQPCLTPAELMEAYCGPDWSVDTQTTLPSDGP